MELGLAALALASSLMYAKLVCAGGANPDEEAAVVLPTAHAPEVGLTDQPAGRPDSKSADKYVCEKAATLQSIAALKRSLCFIVLII